MTHCACGRSQAVRRLIRLHYFAPHAMYSIHLDLDCKLQVRRMTYNLSAACRLTCTTGGHCPLLEWCVRTCRRSTVWRKVG